MNATLVSNGDPVAAPPRTPPIDGPSAPPRGHIGRTAMDQAAQLETLEPEWPSMQDDLATLSTNSTHRVLTDATHSMLVEDEAVARTSSDAILEVVSSVRAATPLDVGDG
jgi:hypothetical protein